MYCAQYGNSSSSLIHNNNTYGCAIWRYISDGGNKKSILCSIVYFVVL